MQYYLPVVEETPSTGMRRRQTAIDTETSVVTNPRCAPIHQILTVYGFSAEELFVDNDSQPTLRLFVVTPNGRVTTDEFDQAFCETGWTFVKEIPATRILGPQADEVVTLLTRWSKDPNHMFRAENARPFDPHRLNNAVNAAMTALRVAGCDAVLWEGLYDIAGRAIIAVAAADLFGSPRQWTEQGFTDITGQDSKTFRDSLALRRPAPTS